MLTFLFRLFIDELESRLLCGIELLDLCCVDLTTCVTHFNLLFLAFLKVYGLG